MSNISNILSFIADNGYTNSSFEKKCGLPNATLANTLKRDGDLTSDVVETISKVIGSDLEAGGFHVMDMRPFGRQELSILSSEEAKKIVSALTVGGVKREAAYKKDGEDEPLATVSHLARALADQAEANKIQAAANEKYASGFASLAIILERVENKMALESTQGRIEKKVDEANISLADAREVEILAAKHRDRRFQELEELLREGRPQKTNASLDERNKPGEIGGDGSTLHKRRKKDS